MEPVEIEVVRLTLSDLFPRIWRISPKHPLSKNPPDFNGNEGDGEKHTIGRSEIIALIISSLILLSLCHWWTLGAIKDGSLYENSRWARIPDAYDTVLESEGDSVIFIGSSRIYSGIDGNCLDEKSNFSINHWNLGIRGDVPYLRLPETEMLKQSGSEVVIIESGPNTFTAGIGERENRLRWEVMTLNHEVDLDAAWYNLVLEDDRKYILDSDLDRLTFVYESYNLGMEELGFRIVNLGESSIDSIDGQMPPPHSKEWLSNLKLPPIQQVVEISQEEMDDYIELLVGSNFWKPDAGNHANRLAIEHIVQEIESLGIEVVLISKPVHPSFLHHLPEGHWDQYNETMEEFSKDRHFIDLTWDIWGEENFTDPQHFSDTGRENLCNYLSPKIIDILAE